MTAADLCPHCGQPLPNIGLLGLCPACLLKEALAGPSEHPAEETGLHDPGCAAATALEAGVCLKYFGDYELLEVIARGGMGVVWKARQTSLHREVALKMIRAGALASADEVHRFLREAEAAASLQHPNIVAIHEVGEHDGQHYFSMDYVNGCDLGALVQKGPLTPPRAARYVKLIAEAIHYAHLRGVLHRDLKPQNILIDAADQPRITDFGLAKIMQQESRLTHSGVVMGSPSYMPPEQAAGRLSDIGPASDVYALGAMLYELLTGRPPFCGTTALATLRGVLEDEPEAPRRLRAAVPPDLETICLKCLEKAPAARYPTARALAEELERFLQGEPIQARPASALRKGVSWARRHPTALAALAALVMVALAFGVFYLVEENALLRAQQANPAHLREPGPYHDALEIFSTINSLVVVAGIWVLIAVRGRARGLTFKHWLSRDLYARPVQPLDARTRTLALGAGLLLLGCGITVLAALIRAYVWEKEPLSGQLALIYVSIYLGLALLGIVVRDYRLIHDGTVAPPLTAAQIEPIRRALEEHDFSSAVQHYRAAVLEADLAQAKQYVMHLFLVLRARDPAKFAPPALSLATLNWNAMLFCAVMEALLLGAWYLLAPAGIVLAMPQFVYSFLLGLGLVAGLRVRGLGRRLLLLVPALATAVLVEIFLPVPPEALSHALGSYLCGFFCGLLLMAFGFNPLLGKRFAKP